MAAVKGVDFVIYVNTGTVESPVWTQVAGQRGATLNRSMDPIDATSKDSQGWMEYLDGLREWSIDFDGLVSEDDTAQQKLEDASHNGDSVMVKIETPGGSTYEGTGYITDLTLEAPYDAEAVYSGTVTGSGALTKS